MRSRAELSGEVVRLCSTCGACGTYASQPDTTRGRLVLAAWEAGHDCGHRRGPGLLGPLWRGLARVAAAR